MSLRPRQRHHDTFMVCNSANFSPCRNAPACESGNGTDSRAPDAQAWQRWQDPVTGHWSPGTPVACVVVSTNYRKPRMTATREAAWFLSERLRRRHSPPPKLELGENILLRENLRNFTSITLDEHILRLRGSLGQVREMVMATALPVVHGTLGTCHKLSIDRLCCSAGVFELSLMAWPSWCGDE